MPFLLLFLVLLACPPLCARNELFELPPEFSSSRVPKPGTQPPKRPRIDDMDRNTGMTGPVCVALWAHPLFLCYGFAPFGMYFGVGLDIDVRMLKLSSTSELFAVTRIGVLASPFSVRPTDRPPPPSALAGSPEYYTSGGFVASTGVRWRFGAWKHGAAFMEATACYAHFAGSEGFRGTTSLGGEFFFGVEFGSDFFRLAIETGTDVLLGLTPPMDRGYLDSGRKYGPVGALLTICRASFRFYFG